MAADGRGLEAQGLAQLGGGSGAAPEQVEDPIPGTPVGARERAHDRTTDFHYASVTYLGSGAQTWSWVMNIIVAEGAGHPACSSPKARASSSPLRTRPCRSSRQP